MDWALESLLGCTDLDAGGKPLLLRGVSGPSRLQASWGRCTMGVAWHLTHHLLYPRAYEFHGHGRTVHRSIHDFRWMYKLPSEIRRLESVRGSVINRIRR